MSLYDGINLQLGSFYFLLFLYISIVLKSLIVLLFFLPPLIMFLILNNNNKAFLGESGVNFLSIFAITLLLKIYNLNYFSIHFDINYLISIFFIPLIDSIRLFFFRILYFGAPFRADKNHIHHKLIKNLGFKFTSVILVSQLLFILILIYFQINSFYLILVNLFFYFYILFRIDGKKSNYNKS